ncbi:DNA (cytosine-5)-methyltransferase 1 [Actinokineospora alba]|uniref:Cytosine-specific methyltransferase n=2 Tax=Actinokineospora alba TaxID=504798 RepID=A0A1H0S512_9PSEU|nr:DNA (cytosine-5)-methyltransferase 1 [Actinokineospora alba]SDI50175.1 DNA (cytosine-5)-methyltransferase 1 [Actinokineospora alba]SDP36774.1 DNA (cytosine-5)-methyltransferase 1 [Actinokineospora alba]
MIDLFAGCGGMTSGFVAAGFTPVLAVEHNLHAAATYAANFGEDHVRWADIATVTDIPRADVIIGGPPCQGFSNLGARDVEDPRNKLWKEYLRFVRAARPRAFVIENVDRFLASAEFALLQAETAPGGLLADYTLTPGVLLAADFGVPQRRKRAFVIGSRVGPIPLPAAAGEWPGVRTVLSGLPETPARTTLPSSSVEFFGQRVPGRFKSADLHLGRNPTALSLERYRAIPPGGGRFDLPDHLLPRCWREKKTGTTDVMGRMRWDAPSLTIRTEFYKPEKGQYLHPEWHRPITHLEAARLQTFPDTFEWCGSKIEIARQIGNAVPPHLATALATHLSPHL